MTGSTGSIRGVKFRNRMDEVTKIRRSIGTQKREDETTEVEN